MADYQRAVAVFSDIKYALANPSEFGMLSTDGSRIEPIDVTLLTNARAQFEDYLSKTSAHVAACRQRLESSLAACEPTKEQFPNIPVLRRRTALKVGPLSARQVAFEFDVPVPSYCVELNNQGQWSPYDNGDYYLPCPPFRDGLVKAGHVVIGVENAFSDNRGSCSYTIECLSAPKVY